MAWVSASTNEYWNEYYGSGFVYVGGGVWGSEGTGSIAIVDEYYASPLIGDPYTYEGAATVSKIKFRLRATASIPRTIYARIKTNRSHWYPESYVPYVFDGLTTHDVEITWTPSPEERPTLIELSGAWGESYLESPTMSLIEVYVETEELPCCRTLYKYAGKVMSIIPDPKPQPIKPIPVGKPKPGDPNIPDPWGDDKPALISNPVVIGDGTDLSDLPTPP